MLDADALEGIAGRYLTPQPGAIVSSLMSPVTSVTVAAVPVLDTASAATIKAVVGSSVGARLYAQPGAPIVVHAVAWTSPAGVGDVYWRLKVNGLVVLEADHNLSPSLLAPMVINHIAAGGHVRVEILAASLTAAPVANCRARVVAWSTGGERGRPMRMGAQ